MTTTMNNREKLMLIFLCNFAILTVFYMLIFKNLMNLRTENAAKIQELTTTLEENTAEISRQHGYRSNAATLMRERRDLFDYCFPSATTERIHAFISGRIEDAGLIMENIDIVSEEPFFAEGTSENPIAIFNNNYARIRMRGTYDNIMEFIGGFEKLERTHQFETFVMETADNDTFICSINLNLFTVEKDVQDDTFYLAPFKEIFYLGINSTKEAKTLNFDGGRATSRTGNDGEVSENIEVQTTGSEETQAAE